MSKLGFQIKANRIFSKKYYAHFKEAAPYSFTVTYHTGALETPANSIESINAALDDGAEILEFDVTFRPDGTAVIIHSDSPSQTEGVLLDDALAAVAKSDKCKINLDIKSVANLPEIDRLVIKHGLFERCFYTGVFDYWVDTVKKNSAIPCYLNHKITQDEATDQNAADALAKKALGMGVIGINSDFREATKLFVETMHENSLEVSLWTVNKPKDMVSVANLRPDNITTKKPHILNDMK